MLLFSPCTEDESTNESCYTCEITQTKYCYSFGNSYFITTNVNGYTTQTKLNGASWSDTQTLLEAQCNGTLPTEDCFTCNTTSTEYCYTLRETFYSISINGTDTTNIELNGAFWTELRAGFVENCYDGGEINGNLLIGAWNLTDFHGTTVQTMMDSAGTILNTLTTTNQGSEYITVYSFSENPNNYIITGAFLNTTEDITGAWELNDAILTISNVHEEYTTTIIELTDTTLKLKINLDETATVNTIITHHVVEFFYTFNRQ